MSSKPLYAVDADILVYDVGFSVEETLDFDSGFSTLIADREECADKLELWVKRMLSVLGRGDVVMCLSDLEHNFRKDVYPDYKGNRGGGRSRPILFKWIREWLTQNYRTELWPSLEADDVMGILMTTENAVAVTIDKDLATVPGRIASPKNGFEVLTVSEEEAHAFFLLQTLTGDRVDGYPGCPGIGEKRAEKILADRTWGEVVGAYEKAGLTEEDALVQARCARILRGDEYNRETGEVNLWEPKTD